MDPSPASLAEMSTPSADSSPLDTGSMVRANLEKGFTVMSARATVLIAPPGKLSVTSSSTQGASRQNHVHSLLNLIARSFAAGLIHVAHSLLDFRRGADSPRYNIPAVDWFTRFRHVVGGENERKG